MPALIWVLILVVALAIVLLQDVPWLGIPLSWGHHPDLIAKAVVIMLALTTLLMSVGRLAQELP